MLTKPGFNQAALITTAFIVLLWVIEILDRMLNLNLYQLGVYPREPLGLLGILYGPLIHGTWNHLLSNSFALLILGTALVYGYPRSTLPVLFFLRNTHLVIRSPELALRCQRTDTWNDVFYIYHRHTARGPIIGCACDDRLLYLWRNGMVDLSTGTRDFL